MVWIIRKKYVALAIVVCCIIGFMLSLTPQSTPVVSVAKPEPIAKHRVVVVDAGHGGEDGGAVSVSGVAESGINLAIACRLKEIFAFLGQEVLMTRSDDKAIYDDDAQTLRQKKVSDLKNRVALVNSYPDAVLISIHQNSLPQHPKVHGAQVFFNTVQGAETLGQIVQDQLNQSANETSPKVSKAIDSSIYLMKEVTCPAALVECGFMSNAAELSSLQNSTYQTTLATAIAAGFTQYRVNEG